MNMSVAALAFAVAIQGVPPHDQHADEVNRRGEAVMGFDQSTTTHHFRLLPDGGSIEVTAKDPADTTAIAQIRMHLQHVAKMFGEGNFTAPMLIHAQQPPGVDGMKAAGGAIGYTFETLDRGARVRIVTTSTAAREAVHTFLRFQIEDHKTGDPLEVQRP